ncbi:Ankyrin repeat domain-containing protein 50 [Symbiodinium microadriaticum]|uniref:Ankyrin repeat domain-containing protein 50 n=1 Tax=Symbiodinium microadriaticum TaxID=2951 RepID=A0A1Q9EUL5_SYMMI|nr:Ankyrin repeat domain-containing protein 50 [Symbiodinium microadriaticum]
MLRITLLSGEELASLPLRQLSDVKALKQRLHEQHGLPPRFRQRLLHEGKALDDAVRLDVAMDLQAVVLPFREEYGSVWSAHLLDAAANGSVTEVEGWLQLPMDPDFYYCGRTPLKQASEMGHFGVAQLLLEAGAKVRWRDNQGRTPLMHAAFHGHSHLVQLFLGAGSRTDVCDNAGHSALLDAAGGGHVPVVRLLLGAAAQTDLRDRCGKTALMVAAHSGHAEIVQLLLEAGAEKDFGDKEGQTALMEASFNGHAAVLKLLLEAGAQSDLRNHAGKTAMTLASTPEVRRLLARAAAPDFAVDPRGFLAEMLRLSGEYAAHLRFQRRDVALAEQAYRYQRNDSRRKGPVLLEALGEFGHGLWPCFFEEEWLPSEMPDGTEQGYGYRLCGLEVLQQRPSCIVYSFGSNDEFDFEDAILARTKCTVRIFDPAPSKSSHPLAPTVLPVALGRTDGMEMLRWWAQSLPTPTPTRTLQSLMREFGDEQIDILKVDIEGGEHALVGQAGSLRCQV